MRLAPLALLLFLAACGTMQTAARPPLTRPQELQAGVAALEGGAAPAALLIARRRLAIDRNDVEALLIAGKALADMGDGERATESFARAASLRPGSVAAQFGLGRLQLAAGLAAAAEASFRRALASGGQDAHVMSDLGVALDMQEKHAEAQASYRVALEAAPGNDAARVNLGLSLALSGDGTGGVAVLRPLGANPQAPPRVRHTLAAALAISGDRPGAERLLRADLTPEQTATALSAYNELLEPGS